MGAVDSAFIRQDLYIQNLYFVIRYSIFAVKRYMNSFMSTVNVALVMNINNVMCTYQDCIGIYLLYC